MREREMVTGNGGGVKWLSRLIQKSMNGHEKHEMRWIFEREPRGTSLAAEADDGGFVDPAEDEHADAAEDPGAPVPLEGEHGGAAPFAGDEAEEGE